MHGNRFQVRDEGRHLRLRAPQEGDAEQLAVFLGEVDAQRIVLLVGAPLPEPEADWVTLREAGASLAPEAVSVAVEAAGMANWHAGQGFCPVCGNRTVPVEAGWVRQCTHCGKQQYPRTDAAVIMSVVDEQDRILLARGPNFAGKGMSVLAGFVEPGESLEAAVAREVMEEVGVAVTDVQYLDDQPWPFPASLMVGFSCRATTTDFVLDPVEIADARWFTRAELAEQVAAGEVRLSPRLSIARHLIEHWFGGPIEQSAGGPFLRPTT